MQNMYLDVFTVVLQLVGALFRVIVLADKSLTSKRHDSYRIFNPQHCALWSREKQAVDPKAWHDKAKEEICEAQSFPVSDAK